MTGELSHIDALERGALPFVGRAEESGRILRFWRETVGAAGLRAMFVVGEAGVGKSRLLSQVLPRIVDEGGVVVRVRFYPESASSLVSLLSVALRESESSRAVLRQGPSESLGPVVSAMRRLARLRPTLLVLEDVHLLGEIEGDAEVAREAATLLSGLADEALAVLCTARPVETSIASIIELYLVERLDLAGISDADIADLWRALFSTDPSSDVRALLHETTLGNPFALLIALRGMVRSGAISADSFDGRWRIRIDPASFAALLRRNADVVPDGMAGHLSRAERRAAGSLSALGWAFSSEAASVMIDDSERMIEQLTARGIVARSGAAIPSLPGARAVGPPFVFTHTLIHRHFVEGVDVDPDRLIRLFAVRAPIYSVLPFELLKDRVSATSAMRDEVQRAVYAILHHVHLADKAPGRRMASRMAATAEALIEGRGDEWSEMDRLRYRLYAINARLMLAYSDRDIVAMSALCDAMLDLTSDLPFASLYEFRIWGLGHRQRLGLLRPDGVSRADLMWNEVDELTARVPEMRFTPAYVQYLYDTARYGHRTGDVAILRDVEERIGALLKDPDAGESARHHLGMCRLQFLLLFESSGECDLRMRDLDELKEMSTDRDFQVSLQQKEIALMVAAGRCERVVDMLEAAERTFREWGRAETYLQSVVFCLGGMIGVGYPAEAIVERLKGTHRLLDSMGVGREPRRMLHALFPYMALGGEEYYGSGSLSDLIGESDADTPESRLLRAILRGGELPDGGGERFGESVVPHLLQALGGSVTLPDDVWRDVAAVLDRPIVRVERLVTLSIILSLVDAMAAKGGTVPGGVNEALARAVGSASCWTDEHGLPGFTVGLIRRFGHILNDEDRTALLARSGALLRERRRQAAAPGPSVRVSMIGAVTVSRQGEESQNIGPRLRAFLGLLVAELMLERPLEYDEFCRLASGEQENRQRARKGMNKAVFRLRELLGQDAVLTDRDVPRLNLDVVQVDLLDAHRQLSDAREAIREGAIVRAVTSLRGSLHLLAAQVPFPSLYDPLFEAIREDIESRLHETLLRVAEVALREGDARAAAGLLAAGLDIMPEDESIAELLLVALERQGRRAEGELLVGRARG